MPSTLLSLIDLTSLTNTESTEIIQNLCQKAQTRLGNVAAICLYPQFIKTAAAYLNKAIPIATVANFPSGTQSIKTVTASIQQSIQDGAQEIDVVFPYHSYLAGDHQSPFEFIRICKNTCGKNILLKVILETGALMSADIITTVSEGVIAAGADFLKTSTGKIPTGATLEAATLMLQAIKHSGKAVGLKVSGGIREIAQAEAYILLAEKIMGKSWISPSHFRIGTSGLIDKIL